MWESTLQTESKPMDPTKPILPVIVIALLIILLLISGIWGDRQSQQLQNFAPAFTLPHQYLESPTAFTFYFPESWQYHIPQVNTLIIAPPELFQLEPAPNIVVQRNLGLIGEGSLNSIMETYLRRGPLNGKHAWRQIGERSESQIAGRTALTTVLQGRDLAEVESEELFTQITITQADNRMVYILVATVPVNQRYHYENTLAAILSSVEILE